MGKKYLLVLLFLLISTNPSRAKSRYDEPSKYPFGVYGGLGFSYPISSKAKNGDEFKLSISFPPELGCYGGYKINRYLEIRSYLYWDMINMKINSNDHDFLLKWRKHNINLDLNLNIFINKNIHQSYLLLGLDFYTTLGYSYEAENPGNIPSNYTISKGLGGVDKVDNIYNEKEKPNRLGMGLNLGSGLIFDSGLVIECLLNIDFSLFTILSSDKFSLDNKGPEAKEYSQMVNATGKPNLKLRLGYDLSNLLP